MKKIIIDCDPSADDAIALMLALASDELAVVGISSVSGVTDSKNAAMNACKILEFCNRCDVPVIVGAKQPLERKLDFDDKFCGLDKLSETNLPFDNYCPKSIDIKEFYDTALKKDYNCSIVSIAPMTNIARYINVGGQINEVITASGNYGIIRDYKRVNPRSSWNIKADPEAAEIVFKNAGSIYAVGLDISLQLNNDMVEHILFRANPKSMKTKFFEAAINFNTKNGLQPYSLLVDSLAIAYCIEPDLVKFAFGNVSVDTKSDILLGNTVFSNVDTFGNNKKNNTYAAITFDFDRYLDLILRRVFS